MDHDLTPVCRQARLELGPDLGPPPATAETDAAHEHVRVCPACQRFYRAQEGLRDRLGTLRGPVAPSDLRSRIYLAIRRESRRDARGAKYRWFVGGALAAAAVLALIVGTPARGPERALAEPLATAARRGLELSTLNSGTVQQTEAWLAEQVGYDLELPDITDAMFVGGRVTSIDGQRAAAAVYLVRGMPVTYFALAGDSVLGHEVPDRPVVATTADYSVALWIEEGRARAIAAPLSRQVVLEIAQECKAKAALY